jgi:hypothetical protein
LRPTVKALNMTGIFPTQFKERCYGGTIISALSANGLMKNGTDQTLGIWNYTTKSTMPKAATTQKVT